HIKAHCKISETLGREYLCSPKVTISG
ncbi:uncharacterized protein METZ01_LOCUS200902, partial [marine metagenome]